MPNDKPTPPKEPRNTRPRRTLAALEKENAELRERLDRAIRERELLTGSVHHLSAGLARNARGMVRRTAKPSLDAIFDWLVATIEDLTTSRPVTGQRTLGDLRVPIPRLVKIINSTWFPGGGGFQDGEVTANTTVGNLAYAIYQRL